MTQEMDVCEVPSGTGILDSYLRPMETTSCPPRCGGNGAKCLPMNATKEQLRCSKPTGSPYFLVIHLLRTRTGDEDETAYSDRCMNVYDEAIQTIMLTEYIRFSNHLCMFRTNNIKETGTINELLLTDKLGPIKIMVTRFYGS